MVSQHRIESAEDPALAGGARSVPRRGASHSPGWTLYRSVVAEVALPTLFTQVLLAVLLLTQDLLGFSNLVINRGLGIETVLWIAFYQTVPIVSQTLPFAVLMGSLIGLGRMGGDRELLVLEASGVSAIGMIGPITAFAVAVTAAGLGLSLYASPWSNRNLDWTLEEVSKQKPAATLSAGVVQNFGDWKVQAREVSPSGEQMKGVLVWQPDLGETVFAERGELLSDPHGARMVLRDGTIFFDTSERPHIMHFEQMSANLDREENIVQRSSSDRLRGLGVNELFAMVYSETHEPIATRARIEIQRRFALPSATLVFGLLAVPLFFSRAHISRAGGGMLGILATLCYYGLVQFGDGVIRSGNVGVAAGVWLPNIAGGAVALVLVFRLARKSTFGRHTDRKLSKQRKAPKPPKPRSPSRRERAAVARQPSGPPRTKRFALARYVASIFLRLLALSFFALLVAYFLVDLLERLEWFATHDPTTAEFAEFYGWRLPLLAARVLPMALLLASGLTVSLLGAHGEMIGMRASGIAMPRALAPVLAICLLITPLYFLLNDEVLPRTNAAYHLIQREIRGEKGVWRAPSTWYRLGSSVIEAADLDTYEGTAGHVKIYDLGDDARPTRRVDAAGAHHIGGGVWRLHDPVAAIAEAETVRHVPTAPFAHLGDDLDVMVDTRHLSVSELRAEAIEVESEGMDATHFNVDYYVKWAAPLSCIVLPAVALFFAIGGPPFPTAPLTAAVSVVVAVTFILTTGVSTSLGYAKTLHPMVAGWAPPALYSLIGFYLAYRLRNLRRR